jgi:hypothetical protein
MTEQPSSGVPLKELPFPEARELAEMLLLREDRRSVRQALEGYGWSIPGVLSGVIQDREQIRGHGARLGDQPKVLSDDGWRHHRGERAGQGLGVHRAAAGRLIILVLPRDLVVPIGPPGSRLGNASAARPCANLARHGLRVAGPVRQRTSGGPHAPRSVVGSSVRPAGPTCGGASSSHSSAARLLGR